MSPNATSIAAAGVDLNDWSVKNWPAVVWYWVKNILYVAFTIIAIGLILSGVVYAIILATTFMINCVERRRKQRQPSNIEDGIAMQDSMPADEDGAAQLLLSEEGDETKTGEEGTDENEALPEYEGKPCTQCFMGSFLIEHSNSQMTDLKAIS